MKRITAIAAVALIVVTAVAVYAITAAGATSATVKLRTTSLGRVLVDAKGRTLYLFEKDRNGRSSCSGACATSWPPLIAARPKTGAGLRRTGLGTTRRADGRTQVTYGGHPLYRFVADTRPGATQGEGIDAFGARWYVVNAAGRKVTGSPRAPTATQTTPAPSPSPYGY